MHYFPFMIDPATQADGEEYAAYNQRRWGGDGWTRSMRAMGRKEGAPYANWKTWPNTTHIGRVLLFAEKHGLGDKLVGILYQMCYEEGENVSLRETVARAAQAAGVPEGYAYAMGDEGFSELAQALRSARVNGRRVSAAPTFNVRVGGAAYDLSGAQETAQWVHILEQLAEM